MNLYSSNLGKSFARKHIIAQLLCPVQRSPMQGFQLSALSINPGSERYCLVSPLTECRVGTIKAG